MTEIEKYAKQWINQATPSPCKLDDDANRFSEWCKKSDQEWQSFLKQLPAHLRKKYRDLILGERTSCWIPIPELKKQIEIEFKIRDIEKEGYIVTKKIDTSGTMIKTDKQLESTRNYLQGLERIVANMEKKNMNPERLKMWAAPYRKEIQKAMSEIAEYNSLYHSLKRKE